MSSASIDEAKLEAFMGQAVTDMGAVISAPLFVIGEKLGLYKAMAGAGPLTSAGGRRADRCGRAVRPRVAREPGRRRLRRPTTRTRALHAARRAGARARRRGQPVLHPRRVRARSPRSTPTRTRSSRRSAPARAWAGTSTTTACSAAPSASSVPATGPTWSPSGSRRWTASRRSSSGARRSPTSAAATAPRPSSWPRPSPTREFFGFDYHDASIERPARPPRRPASADRVTLRGRVGQGLPGHGLRPRLRLRLPARHGRPGRRRRARPRGARRRRHLDDRRAERRRQRRGQPQPGRPGLLRRLDDDLHARLPVDRRSGSRSAPRPARRGSPR